MNANWSANFRRNLGGFEQSKMDTFDFSGDGKILDHYFYAFGKNCVCNLLEEDGEKVTFF